MAKMLDSALRKLICAEMEKIEISLRTIISQELSHTYSPYWFTDKSLFANKAKHSGILSGVEAELKRSDDDQILDFKKTYCNQFPPSWMTMEVSSFTTRLKRLLNDYTSADIKAMGFPSNWESEPLWNTK